MPPLPDTQVLSNHPCNVSTPRYLLFALYVPQTLNSLRWISVADYHTPSCWLLYNAVTYGDWPGWQSQLREHEQGTLLLSRPKFLSKHLNVYNHKARRNSPGSKTRCLRQRLSTFHQSFLKTGIHCHQEIPTSPPSRSIWRNSSRHPTRSSGKAVEAAWGSKFWVTLVDLQVCA